MLTGHWDSQGQANQSLQLPGAKKQQWDKSSSSCKCIWALYPQQLFLSFHCLHKSSNVYQRKLQHVAQHIQEGNSWMFRSKQHYLQGFFHSNSHHHQHRRCFPFFCHRHGTEVPPLPTLPALSLALRAIRHTVVGHWPSSHAVITQILHCITEFLVYSALLHPRTDVRRHVSGEQPYG